MPKEVRDKVPFVCTSNITVLPQMMEAVGLNSSNMIKFSNNDNYILLYKLYTISLPFPTSNSQGNTLLQIRGILFKNLNLSETKPIRYVLMNRSYIKRVISEFDLFASTVRKIYNKYN